MVVDVSSEASHNATFKTTGLSFIALPSKEEVQACWELCRLHNNIGFWVVYIPTAWSIAMAYHAQEHLSIADALVRAAIYVPLCFGVKSLIMTIDDILDYDIDGMVERTKGRPLPRGSISLQRAWLFFAIQTAIGVRSAFYFLSTTSLHVSMFAWPLYIIYPTCKRWMGLAPIPLGLMFNVGIFMGWGDLSINGSLPWHILVPIYIGTCMWTFTYETVYQHQDKIDDVKIGINSPALFCGTYTIPICTATAVGFFGLLSYGAFLNGQGAPVYIAIAITSYLLLNRLLQTDIDRPDDCKTLFLGTVAIGQIVLGGFVIDAISHRLLHGIPL
ncbi:UbiA prenyltransferase [Pleurotus eryngii]|uniref:UbiA prenyltransferase n=1 Tax=Pleurotus eryngii TaxID=5323 RepID=A0A9P6DJY7_PLEER|nr:UbiA prenyltransferase [Pleurotus eryngii]